MDIFEHILTPGFATVIVGIFAVIYTVRITFPKAFAEGGWGCKALPFVPLVLGAVAMLFVSDMPTVGERLLHGLFAGFIAGHAHKMAGRIPFLKDILAKQKKEGGAENGDPDQNQGSAD